MSLARKKHVKYYVWKIIWKEVKHQEKLKQQGNCYDMRRFNNVLIVKTREYLHNLVAMEVDKHKHAKFNNANIRDQQFKHGLCDHELSLFT